LVIWKRKVYRIVMGSLIPLSYIITKNVFLPLLISTFFLTLLGALEYERWKNPSVWEWMIKRYGGVFKKKVGRLTGDTYFMISNFLVLLFFPYEIAVYSLFFLTFEDAGSGIVGKKFGKREVFKGKTFEGLLGGILFNLIIGFILFPFIKIPLPVLFTGIFISSFIEILPLKVDDNLSVGILTPLFMYLVYRGSL